MLIGWSTKEADVPQRRSTNFGSVQRRSVCARHSGGRAKKYYVYPFPYGEEDGDQDVRAYLHRNWKSYLNVERSRLVEKVKHPLEAGYTENDFNIKDEGLKPYYYSQRT
ncbi:hypothetical protein AgCh_022292 [Apium graveolens]